MLQVQVISKTGSAFTSSPKININTKQREQGCLGGTVAVATSPLKLSGLGIVLRRAHCIEAPAIPSATSFG